MVDDKKYLKDIENIINEEIDKRTLSLSSDVALLNKNKNELNAEINEIQNRYANVHVSELMIKSLKLIQTADLASFVSKYLLKDANAITMTSYFSYKDSVWLYLLSKYWKNKNDIIQLLNLIDIGYPKTLINDIILPFDLSKDQLVTIVDKITNIGAYFDATPDINYWYKSGTWKAINKFTQGTTLRVPISLLLRNPFFADDYVFNLVLSKIKTISNSNLLYNYLKLPRINKNISIPNAERMVMVTYESNKYNNTSFKELLNYIYSVNKDSGLFSKLIAKGYPVTYLPKDIARRIIREMPDKSERIKSALKSKLFSESELSNLI